MENDCVAKALERCESIEMKWAGFRRNMETLIGGSMHQLQPETFVNRRNVTKTHMGMYLSEYNHLLLNQDTIIDDLKTVIRQLSEEKNGLLDEVDQLKSSTISAQNSIIDLQKELLTCKDQQLTLVQSSVKETVQSTVKSEFKLYSEAVGTSQKPAPAIKSIKKAVEEVVKAEDRSKNLIVFGLPEVAEESTVERIEEMFEFLGEKPKQESVRIGMKSEKRPDRPRPVKVSLASATHAQQILRSARRLRGSEQYKAVFICPDRTVEERKQRQETVSILKEKRTAEPNKYHFIKDGRVLSAPLKKS